jgi:hypothetical protein
METINNGYVFWTTDPTILYKNEKYLEFVPTSKMTRIEQLNAVTRFCIYFFILAYITGKPESWYQFPIISIIFVYILYAIFEFDKKGQMDELNKTETFADQNDITQKYSNIKDDYIIESGIEDENGIVNFDKYQSSNKKSKKIKYDLNKFEEYTNATCRMPTPDNPFMNPTVNDFGVEMPPEACNADDDVIKEKIVNTFNENLFRDGSDLFERQNSQRQYYTVPIMNPPDTINFAKWLYKPEDICKLDQTKCLRYEDISYNR